MNLLELVVAAALLAVVGLAINGIFISQSGIFKKETANIDTSLSLNNSLQQIDSDIRQASQIMPGSDDTKLILKIDVINDTITISRDSDNKGVLREQGSTVNRVLSTLVNDLKFAYQDKNGNVVSPISASRVIITLTLNDKTVTKVTNLRNSSQ